MDAIKSFFYRIYLSHIPNSRDNLKQIIVKTLFLVSLVTLIVSSSFIINYFVEAQRQAAIIDESRQLWNEVSKDIEADSIADQTDQTASEPEDPYKAVKEQLLLENSDFKGWITISGTPVNNPIYQTDNNEYYLSYNQQRKRSAYGALYFDCENIISEEFTDKNLIVYGHQMKNGTMFGSLKKFKSLNFYKQNPTIEFSTLYKNSTYKIYSIFILNAVKSDDDGYIYNVGRNKFINENDFNAWRNEAYERSVITTSVDVLPEDNILTLITCSSDFPNARLVIMAREVREGESTAVDTNSAKINPNPRYPRKWYTHRGIK